MSVLNRPLFRQTGGPVDGPAQAMPEDIPMRRAGETLGSIAGSIAGSMAERNIPLSSHVFVAMSRMVEPGDAASTPEQALQEAASIFTAARTQKEVDEVKRATQQYFLEFASKAGIPAQRQLEILDGPLARSIQNFKLAPRDEINRKIRANLENEPSSIAKMGGGDIDEAVRFGRSLYDTEMDLRRLQELKGAPQRNRREIRDVLSEMRAAQGRIDNSDLTQSDIRSLERGLMPERNKFGDPYGFVPSEAFGIENRAMGGEMMASEQMMAPPPPQTMAPGPAPMPPGAEAVQQTEQMAVMQGEKIGQDYAQRMMQGIDQAQSTEELINAFRGNEMPLEARRDELAGYVGEGDATQTPESVLAMVQPVIMMTEEGAMNSGIGNLMQQLTGDIDMMTEAGAPTDMGQGVGSLMMAGAPEAPAPQNFRQGGEVAYLDNGSGPTATAPSNSFTQAEFLQALQGLAGSGYSNLGFNPDNVSSLYTDKLLPLFNQITDQEERAAEEAEARQLDKTLAALSVGQFGLRLAAGDPKAGGSLVSQAAAAAEPTVAELAALGAGARKRRSDIRAEDRALRTAALQGSMAIEQQAASDRLALETAKINARRQTYDFDTYVKPITDNPETEEVESGLETIEVDPRNRREIQRATDQGYKEISVYRAETGGDKPPKPMIVQNRLTGEVVANIDLSTQEGRARRDAMTSEERMVSPGTEEKPERAVVILEDGTEYPSTTGGRSYVEDNVVIATPTDARVLKGNDLSDHITKKKSADRYSTILDSTLVEIDAVPSTLGLDPLTLIVSAKKGLNIGKPQAIQGGSGVSQTGGNVVPAALTDPEVAKIIQNLTPDVFQAALDGTGPIAMIQATFDRLFGAGPVDPSIFVGDTERAQRARQNLRAAMILSRSALVDEDSSRYVVSENEAIGSLFADPDSFFQNPETQASKLSQLKQAILGRYIALLQRGSVGELGSTATSRAKREQKINQLATVLRLFQSVPIEAPIDDARVDRNQQRLDKILGIAD